MLHWANHSKGHAKGPTSVRKQDRPGDELQKLTVMCMSHEHDTKACQATSTFRTDSLCICTKLTGAPLLT